MCAGDVNVRFL